MFLNLLLIIPVLFFMFVSIVFYLSYKKEKLPKIPKIKKYPTISVIIPVLNEVSTVEGTIKSLRNAGKNYDANIEIIVVDDGSSDGTYELLKSIKDKYDIRYFQNIVKSKGLNVNFGAKYATGELLAVIDADTFVDDKIFNKMVPYLQDENIGSVVANVVVKNSNNLVEIYQEREYIVVSFIRRALSSMNGMYITPGGGFPMYRRKQFLSLGGYCGPEILTEDMEVAMKLIRNNLHVKVIDNARSYTRVPSTLKKLFRQRVRWYRGTIQTFKKYPDMLFSSKYNIISLFVLPLFFFIIFATFLIYLNILYSILTEFNSYYISIKSLFEIRHIPNFFDISFLYKNPLFLIDPMLLFLTISFLIGLLIIYEGMIISDKKVDLKFFLAFLSMIICSPILFLSYFIAFYEEYSKKPNRWW